MLNHDSSGEQELLSYNFSLKDSQISHIKRLSQVDNSSLKELGIIFFMLRNQFNPHLKNKHFAHNTVVFKERESQVTATFPQFVIIYKVATYLGGTHI